MKKTATSRTNDRNSIITNGQALFFSPIQPIVALCGKNCFLSIPPQALLCDIIYMEEMKGIGVFPGVVTGKTAVFRHAILGNVDHILIDTPETELESFRNAHRSVLEEIKNINGSTKEERDMLAVYESMLTDPDFLSLIKENIVERRYNASWAVEAATEKYTSALAALGDAYFAERINDIRDAEGLLLSSIAGISSEVVVPEPAVLVADYLTPSELIQMDRSNVLGILLDTGGPTSHVAILCHSDEIPAILGLGDISSKTEDGDTVAMDAREGIAILSPDEKTLRSFRARKGIATRTEKELRKEADLPAVTLDGKQVHLMCNIEGVDGIDSVINAGAEGVGLFRTEFMVLGNINDSEEKKAAAYEEVARRIGDRGPVTFRTYDLGGDKMADCMYEGEENPVLGWRAVRFCMERKDIFRSQLISILRASAVSPSVRLMFPMISGSEELLEVLGFLEEVKSECREKGIAFDENMKIGTMIETPSAAITADVLVNHVDFMSIGTNDLIQYTIAVDRGNEKIAHLYRPLHPAVLRLLKYVSDVAGKAGVPLSICGEMAGHVEYIPLLVGLGFDELSMTAHSVLEARKRIRELRADSCRDLADRILSLPDATKVEEALREFNEADNPQ